MMDLQFSTGVNEYSLNGKVKVHFNPTDTLFIEKLMNTFDTLEEKGKAANTDFNNERDMKAVFAAARRYDSEMRTIIDGIFDVPVCDALFGDMNVYAAANGLPVWCNLLLSCLDVVYENIDGLEDGLKTRVKSISAKYHRKYKD